MKPGTHYLGPNGNGQDVFVKIGDGGLRVIRKRGVDQLTIEFSAEQIGLLKGLLK